MAHNTFRRGIFPLQLTEGSGNPSMLGRGANVSDRLHLKMLTPKQMLQRLPITLAQVKAGCTPENLLNEIRQKP